MNKILIIEKRCDVYSEVSGICKVFFINWRKVYPRLNLNRAAVGYGLYSCPSAFLPLALRYLGSCLHTLSIVSRF